jgi:cell division protein FtsL
VPEGHWQTWAVRIGLALTVAAVLTYLPYRVLDGPNAERLVELKSELDRAKSEISRLEQENRALLLDVHSLKENPTAILEFARAELGMALPGDLVFRLEPQP